MRTTAERAIQSYRRWRRIGTVYLAILCVLSAFGVISPGSAAVLMVGGLWWLLGNTCDAVALTAIVGVDTVVKIQSRELTALIHKDVLTPEEAVDVVTLCAPGVGELAEKLVNEEAP